MQFTVGQGVLGRIRFKDGNMPEYDRPYLIVSVGTNYIKVLNVSTIRGKERKLFFPNNERIIKYKPPFLYPSFVKLDSLTRVSLEDCQSLQLLYHGQTIDDDELERIISLLI